MAGKTGPMHRQLAFLDPLLRPAESPVDRPAFIFATWLLISSWHLNNCGRTLSLVRKSDLVEARPRGLHLLNELYPEYPLCV